MKVLNEIDGLRAALAASRKREIFFGIIIVVLLVISYRESNNSMVTVIPPSIEKGFWINRTEVSPSYLEEMATYLIQLKVNYTPKTFKYKSDLLLKYVDPTFYGAMKKSLTLQDTYVRKNDISSIFYASSIVVDGERLKTKVTGELKTWVGKELLPVKKLSYIISFSYANGFLTVKEIKEVK